MDDLTKNRILHCKRYYENRFERVENGGLDTQRLDTVLHAFLNGSPSGSYSSLERAVGLASADLWDALSFIDDKQIVKFSLSQMFRFDDALPLKFVNTVTALSPDVVRWAIRYSKIFEKSDSRIYLHLRTECKSESWCTFFAVCDRLLVQLEPYKNAVSILLKKLNFMTLSDFFCYLSVIAWDKYFANLASKGSADFSRVYDRILQMKLETTKAEAKRLNSESKIVQSMKSHLMPLLMPEAHPKHAYLQCEKNLKLVADLFWYTQELIDYEGSIDWFCYDEKCRYQFETGKSVLFNEDDSESERWRNTGQKINILWHYWFNRGIEQFLSSDMSTLQIGSEQNQDANLTAVTKAFRSCLQLEALYGISDSLYLADDIDISLFELMLTTELHSAMFAKDYVKPLYENITTGTPLLIALRDLMLQGFVIGENRLPFTWSEINAKASRISDWFISETAADKRKVKAQLAISFWSQCLDSISNESQSPTGQPIARLHEKPFLKINNFVFQLPWLMADSNHLNAVVNNLRRLNSRRPALKTETQNAEEYLANSLRAVGFNVEVGYQPERINDDNVGEIDLICHKDNVVLLLEVKTSYVRGSAAEIWLYRNTTLRKAAWQLKRKSHQLHEIFLNDPILIQKLGIDEFDYSIHNWIVDTSIDFDGVVIDGCRVVSREVLEIVLRDDMHLMDNIEKIDSQRESLFQAGFSAAEFVEIIESQALWQRKSIF